MSDYIKREDAIKVIVDYAVPQMYFPTGGVLEEVGECVESVLNNAPSQDVAPVRHGRWEKNDDYTCSLCGYRMVVGDGAYNYCPNCGAHMMDEEK